MNIKDVSGINGVTPVDSRSSSPSPKDTSRQDTQPGSTGDTLSLTSAGQYLAASDLSAPVDKERVEAIRNALASGTYELDAGRVATRLLALDRELA